MADKNIEYYREQYYALPEKTKEIFISALNAQTLMGKGYFKKILAKISELTGIAYDVLEKAFWDTPHGKDYNLNWLANAGYPVPQFMFDWKDAVRKGQWH